MERAFGSHDNNRQIFVPILSQINSVPGNRIVFLQNKILNYIPFTTRSSKCLSFLQVSQPKSPVHFSSAPHILHARPTSPSFHSPAAHITNSRSQSAVVTLCDALWRTALCWERRSSASDCKERLGYWILCGFCCYFAALYQLGYNVSD
jgi:hypothetical protein